MFKKLLTSILLFTFFISSMHAQVSKKISVLFLGNSYTYVNVLPNLVQQLGYAMGDSIFVDYYAVGGYTLQLHSVDANTITKINQQQWDYVVLQEQSQLPSFPPSQVMTDVIPYALQLDSMIKANNPCTKTVFYMTWGRKYGDASNCAFYPPVCTYLGMQQRLKDSYLLMADTTNSIVAPVGEAFHLSIQTDSTLELYQTDQSHPSLEGSYLAASTFYSCITHKQITNQNYTAGLSATTAAYLQNMAWQTVIDSSELWNLGVNEPFANFTWQQVGNGLVQFNSLGNQNYQHVWYFGDSIISTAINPIHQYLYSHYFPVSHVVYDNCRYDSTVVITNVSFVAGINQFTDDNGSMVFDQQSQSLIIDFKNSSEKYLHLTLHNDAGVECLNQDFVLDRNKKIIPLMNLADGIYVAKLYDNDLTTVFSKKVTVLH